MCPLSESQLLFEVPDLHQVTFSPDIDPYTELNGYEFL